MKINKFKKNIRAISPVIATLLMIAIAVVASLVVYAWVMGYMNFTQNKTGKAILIQSAAPITAQDGTMTGFTIYVQNVGDSAVKFALTGTSVSGIYVNSAQVTFTLPTTGSNIDSNGALQTSNTGVLQATSYTLHHADTVQIKVTTADGAQNQLTWNVP